MSTVLSMIVIRLVGKIVVPGSQIQEVMIRASSAKGAIRAAHVGRYRESKNIRTSVRSSAYASKTSHGRGRFPDDALERRCASAALLRIKSSAAGSSCQPELTTVPDA